MLLINNVNKNSTIIMFLEFVKQLQNKFINLKFK